MPEFTEAQFNQLAMQINKMPLDKLKAIFAKYTYQGRCLTTADFPHIEAGRKVAVDAFLNEPKPNAAEMEEWAHIVPLLGSPGEELRLLLQRYIEHWQGIRPLQHHLEEAQSRLQQLTVSIEGADWERVDFQNLDSLEQYLLKYPGSAHRAELDHQYWNQVSIRQILPLGEGIRRYLSVFPAGLHAVEAQEVLSGMDAWEAVEHSGSLQTVFDFIREHPSSPFYARARVLLDELKQKEIQEMKERFNEYSREDLVYYLNQGIFTEDELFRNGVATSKSIQLLHNYKEMGDALPNLDEVVTKCRSFCFDHHTDVFMFGIPGTGKSCILAGLISSNELKYNSVRTGGEYADALAEYVRYGCPPPPTRESYLTTIEASICGMKDNNQINLVEMAGEEFAFKISENDENIVKFEDMGSGATQLLGSDNRKVFFLVVDPTKSDVKHVRAVEMHDSAGDIYYEQKTFIVRQHKCLKRMVDLFGLPENESLMRKVDAIHIILTKSDMLDCSAEQREQKAVQVFMDEYAQIVGTLIEICRKYNINKSTGGRPKLYTFSLGNFYVGNIFDYNSHDSVKILNAIKEGMNVKRGFFSRF